MKTKHITFATLFASLIIAGGLSLGGCSDTTTTVKDASATYTNGENTVGASAGEIDYSSGAKATPTPAP